MFAELLSRNLESAVSSSSWAGSDLRGPPTWPPPPSPIIGHAWAFSMTFWHLRAENSTLGLVKHPSVCTCGGLRLSYACAAEEHAPFQPRVCPGPSHCPRSRPCVRSLSRVPLCDPMACSLARLLCLFLTQWIPEEDCRWEADLRLVFRFPRLTALWITPLPLQA